MAAKAQTKIAVAVLGLASAAIGSVALASPGSGVTGTLFVRADNEEVVHFNSDRVKLQTKGATDVLVQRLVFAPGAHTGWHHHPGVTMVAVQSGLVVHKDSRCETKTYGPGSPNGAVFIEGGDDPHEASSVEGATVYTTSIAPDATPPVFRIEDSPPFCARTL
jgi:quercetin dioxygenase-like cupin family protein